jgi:hypothetical protein
MKMELPEVRPEERTPLVESLLTIIHGLLDQVQQLGETVQQLRDEIAVLKGQKPRPQIKPSCLESDKLPTGEKPTAAQSPEKRPGSAKRSKNSQLTIHHERKLHIDDLPIGAVFKCYEPYVVQDLIIKAENTRYWRARYELPGDGSILAPLPPEASTGHFSASLVSYILHQYHAAHVTQPLLLQQLHDFGVDISAGQLNRILTEGKEDFHEEKFELLIVGLTVSSWVGTDDTGGRHQGKNNYCTTIGNDLFTYFETTASKSRVNFFEVMHGGERFYVINPAAQAYCQEHGLAAAVVHNLSQAPCQFDSEEAWQARLKELDITRPLHVRLATEGALLGGLIARGIAPELTVLSDGAPQFVVFVHASCWVHAERPLQRLLPHNEQHRTEIDNLRGQIWDFYQELKAYRAHPDPSQKPILEAHFDAFSEQKTVYPSINGVLKEMRDHKADLLRVLDRPEIPLHNNGRESDIREYVKRRKISGSTRSDDGRRCRDTFASLKKTCRKLGVNFWDYLKDRIQRLGRIPRLSDLIREGAAEDHPPNVEAVPA